MLVEDSESELGHWRTFSRSPAVSLRAYVRGYFGSDGFIPAAIGERHLPATGVALMINFAAPHRLVEREAGDIGWGRRAWVVGLQTHPRMSEAAGEREFLAVSLTPTGAWRLLRTPMDALTDRIVELEDIDPDFARRLLARVGASNDWDARFTTLDEIFCQRLVAGEDSGPDLLVRLSACRGEVGRLANELGHSHRWLIARFREQIGLPPKAVMRLQRFNRALAAINQTQRLPWPEGKPYLEGRMQAVQSPAWAGLALACGYYDQAHFINEFRSFAGCPPGAFIRAHRHEPAAG